MFKCARVFLSAGGDGVPFPFNSPVGYLFGSFDCLTADLAVSPVHIAYFIVFFLVFCYIDDP